MAKRIGDIISGPAHGPKRRKWTDYFLPPHFYADADLLHRSRVLVSALYAFAGLTALMIPFVFVAPLATSVQLAITASCSTIVAAFVYLLFMLKLHGSYMWCAVVAVAIPSVSITSAICISGGISQSPVTQLLALQPMVAFFFTGLRGGRMAIVAVFLLVAILFVLQQVGIDFPQWVNPEHHVFLGKAILLIGFFVIVVMALVYEVTSTSLRRERDHEHAKVVLLANTDSLTGLANRRAFDEGLRARIDSRQRDKSDQGFALCYLDLDGFKPINDQHGHDVGDQVLRAVSIRLRSALRGADMIGRQGGDEFMLLLNGVGANQSMEAMAQRFLDMVKQPIETSAGLVGVGVSMGFSVYPDQGVDTEQLKKAADSAMYNAKRRRAGWLMYSPSMVDEGGCVGDPP